MELRYNAANLSAPARADASDEQIDEALEGVAALIEAAPKGTSRPTKPTCRTGPSTSGWAGRPPAEDELRLGTLVSQVRALAKLPPLARSVARWRTADGVEVEERRVPVGVIGAVHEARPNVTADVATQLIESETREC